MLHLSVSRSVIVVAVYYYYNITFIQGIYNSILGTNLVPRVSNFTAILLLQYMVSVMLFRMMKVLYVCMYYYY